MLIGDRRKELEALQAKLVAASEGAEPRELPAVSRELRLVMAELEDLKDVDGNGIADELDKQRARRLARPEASGS